MSLFDHIDEVTPDDADYIVSSGNPANDSCEVKLASLSDPVSSSGHIIRYRYAKDLDVGQVDLMVNLVQGTTIIATWNHSDISTTITLAEQTLSAGEANSITDYADLRLRFTADRSA